MLHKHGKISMNMTRKVILLRMKLHHWIGLQVEGEVGQQVDGGNSPFLLCSCETPPEVLCHPLRPSAQGRHGPDEKRPKEGNKDIHGPGTPLPWKKGEEPWIFQFGEKQALGRYYCSPVT